MMASVRTQIQLQITIQSEWSSQMKTQSLITHQKVIRLSLSVSKCDSWFSLWSPHQVSPQKSQAHNLIIVM